MSNFLKIGVIGGAGPLASCFLCQKIFSLCQNVYDSCDYSDFPEVVLISYPFTRGNQKLIQKDLADCEKRLCNEKVDVFCIASHSFHGYFKQTTSLKFVNLIDLVSSQFASYSKSLILAAQTTLDLKLYEQKSGKVLYPELEDQKVIQRIIKEIASGYVNSSQINLLRPIIQKNINQHQTESVILACTELPILLDKFSLDIDLKIIDSTEILANALVKKIK